ncbi:hypothetical protein Pcinc_022323 [Petrolisthes cinctipes]|uniref:Uncharacterized protein n=1 Tax=Petrolisthes cinctipes TaxID=88211 RepID=A0AAE1FFD2_PETCI|nr:hypothetical protein Pcinc_022323 [Petrolisthes cinctipes]
MLASYLVSWTVLQRGGLLIRCVVADWCMLQMDCNGTVINHDSEHKSSYPGGAVVIGRLSRQGSSVDSSHSATVHVHTPECCMYGHPHTPQPRTRASPTGDQAECDFHCCSLHEEGGRIQASRPSQQVIDHQQIQHQLQQQQQQQASRPSQQVIDHQLQQQQQASRPSQQVIDQQIQHQLQQQQKQQASRPSQQAIQQQLQQQQQQASRTPQVIEQQLQQLEHQIQQHQYHQMQQQQQQQQQQLQQQQQQQERQSVCRIHEQPCNCC